MSVSITSATQALQALETGAVKPALMAADVALQRNARQPDWLLVRALAHTRLGDPARACIDWTALCELQPRVPEHWCNLGNGLLESGNFAGAREALERAAHLGDRSPALGRALALCLLELGQPRAAHHLAVQLHAGLPQVVEAALILARSALAVDEQPQALAALDAAVAAGPDAGEWLDWAYLNLEAGRYAQAHEGFQLAARAPALTFAALVGAGLAAERSNRMPEALAAHDQALALQAGASTRARSRLHLLQARLKLREDAAGSVPLLRELLATDATGVRADPSLRYYLGRALDAAGDTQGAIAAWQEGHALRLQRARAAHPGMGDAVDLLGFLDRPVPAAITSPLRSAADPSVPAGETSDPVFLVGFPRSGTTLLEQLLDAHPRLASFDEQPFLQRLIEQLDQALAPARYPQSLLTLTADGATTLRTRYDQLTAQVCAAGPGVRRIDKNPLNMVRLPLVQAIFPQAQVLLAVRHPCDVVLSCWMQDFRAPGFAVSFHDVPAIARMYDRVFRYFEQCVAHLALPVHTLRYEDLVDDVAGEARRLCTFLGLPWSEQMLAFTARAAGRSISTPSYAAVTQPVNRRAVGRWRRYADLFDSQVRAWLEPWCIRFGYRWSE